MSSINPMALPGPSSNCGAVANRSGLRSLAFIQHNKMQCFICVTYMIILCTAQPTKDHAVATTHEKRSLFRDVIESLRIRSQLPDEINLNDGNNLSQNYDRYGLDNEQLELPSDAYFVPRRNDRIEMPTSKYRFPKSLEGNSSDIAIENKKEDIIVYVSTPTERSEPKSTTQRPKKEPKPDSKPSSKLNFVKKQDYLDADTEGFDDNLRPIINRMEDLSQIGNREYQTVIKPTVIVNFRGSVSHKDSEIRLEKRNNPKRKQEYDSARNIFNINQEIKVEHPNGTIQVEGMRHLRNDVKQSVDVLADKIEGNPSDNMTMCETAGQPMEENERVARENDSIIQIFVTL